MTANVTCTVEQRRLLRNSRCLLAGSDSLSVLAVQTDNLSSLLPTQTHQLHRSTSRTSFFDTITSCRETAVVLDLSNVNPLRILDFTRQNAMLINPLND